MPKRAKTFFTLLAFLAVAAIVVLLKRDQEPRYKNHSLSWWIVQYWAPHDLRITPAAAKEAVTHIGTNGLPWLLTWIQNPTHSTRPFEIANHAPSWLPNFVRVHLFLRAAPNERWLGIEGFQMLGPLAYPAMPQLIALTAHTNWVTATAAITSISSLGKKAEPAVPTLLKCLQSPVPHVAPAAIHALGTIALRADISLPALSHALKSTNHLSRALASKSLAAFGSEARVYAPLILQATTDPEYIVRLEATNALLSIAPEILTNVPAH